jgi:hypothetical protein
MLRQLANQQLADHPITACLLLLLVAVGLSHLAHGFFWAARMSMYEVGKLLIFYLLLTGVVNTPKRLLLFIKGLALAITVVASLALLDRYQIVSIAAFESIQDHGGSSESPEVAVERIRGTGIFQDPNDFGLILVSGLILSASCFMRPSVGWPRHFWLIPIFILMSALALTHSRGALLSFACALPAALAYRAGWKVALLSLISVPLLAIAFSARMTDINALSEGTGQSRIQIWSDSLMIWRQYPVFGLGEGLLVDELGVVTHNSFLHCFAELGVIGGLAFLGAFLAAIIGLWQLRDLNWTRDKAHTAPDSLHQLAHLRMFIFAALAAYAVGILTISRQFVVPTYLVLGLASAAQLVSPARGARLRVGNRFIIQCVLAGMVSIFFFYISIRLLVRW